MTSREKAREALTDERAKFEKWAVEYHGNRTLTDPDAGSMWSAWQARAALDERPQAEPVAPRFFMDHGLWHDRETGQHLYTQSQYDEARRDAAVLAQQEMEALAARRDRSAPPVQQPSEPVAKVVSLVTYAGDGRFLAIEPLTEPPVAIGTLLYAQQLKQSSEAASAFAGGGWEEQSDEARDAAVRIVEAVRRDGDPAFAHLLAEFDAAMAKPDGGDR